MRNIFPSYIDFGLGTWSIVKFCLIQSVLEVYIYVYLVLSTSLESEGPSQ